MYNFKHHINDNERYNIYESYNEDVEFHNTYYDIRNALLVIALIISIFMVAVISINMYKENNNTYSQTLVKNYVQQNEQKDELSHLALTQAISSSIIHNLQSQPTLQNMNDVDLKRIIKKIVNKIETTPRKFIYAQN